jgi:ubiquinone/menaquinone biosynthesis C-methylase UbiE
MSKIAHLSCSEIYGAVHDQTVSAISYLNTPKTAKLLDVGCWDGEMTLRYAAAAGINKENVFGVEIVPAEAKIAEKYFKVAVLDIEKDNFPYPDNYFDVLIVNQVFEHLKNIFRPISEIYRVLKTGGYLIFSVPNLSSFHNRILLLSGNQPTSIRAIGPHVRGYAAPEVMKFLEFNNHFRVVKKLGIGFYPTLKPLTDLLARTLPGISHTVVWVAVKNKTSKPNWMAEISKLDLQSDF